LDVSESGFHAWNGRPESQRAIDDRTLGVHIKAAFVKSRETYGSPRIKEEMAALGISVGKHKIARLMKESSLMAKKPKRSRKTTDSNHALPIAPNLVERKFDEMSSEPNKLWVTDLTYIWTWQGWMYLCVFIDVFSRKVVGWSLADNMEATMVCRAARIAQVRRCPGAGLICHSDRGSQYASGLFQSFLKDHDIAQSMSRKGDCWDNAVAESFFATIKGDLIDRRSWPIKEMVELAVKEYIEVFYNGERRHSSIGNISPIQFENLTRLALAA
jgi:transposase InsO family protein